MNIRTYTLPALLVGALLASSSAQAADPTSSLTVKLTINGTCAIAGGSVLQFSPQTGAFTSNIDNDVDMKVTCTKGQTFEVGADNGINSLPASGTNPAQRRMRGAADTNAFVNYQLYTLNGRNQVLGRDWGTANTIGPTTATGNQQNIKIFGRVPPMSAPSADDYTDTVVVTVHY